MLIDTRQPPPLPPDPEAFPRPDPARRRRWDLGEFRRLWLLAAGLGLALLSGLLSPIPAYVVLLGACVCIGRGLGGIVRNTPGLKDHHQ